MLDFVVIGAGNIGSEIANKLSDTASCGVLDPSERALSNVNASEKFAGTIENSPEILSKANFFVVSLPGSIAELTVRRLLKSGKKVVDVSFYNEDPFQLAHFATGEAAYMPDCGFAPGLSNIMVGNLFSRYRSNRIGIYVGGLPASPREPFLHSVTWSVEGLIDEYIRPAKIVRNGRVTEVDPLEERIPYQTSDFPEFEGFYSDGLRTLLQTIKVPELFEVTLRYKGHLDRMKLLRDMGFFNGSGPGSARFVTESVFSGFKDPEDRTILDVASFNGGVHSFELRDCASGGITSMSRLTGHTAAIVASLKSGDPEFRGFTPPETIGFDQRQTDQVFGALSREGVKITRH